MENFRKIFEIPRELISRSYSNGESLPEYRSEFMRDRDRIMYATAFRRLAGKTQIFTVGDNDHKKNRLTHTLEVSQIARTIAKALELDKDLTEAIALGHDFGHTPFGHAGEQMLHDIMVPDAKVIKNSPFYGKNLQEIKARYKRESVKAKKVPIEHFFGFKHNIQSVRVVEVLEDSYRNSKNQNIGLNLTNYTLFGIMNHSALQYKDTNLYRPQYQNAYSQRISLTNSENEAWSFEAYIVKHSDDIAQWHHDFEDAMRAGLLPLKEIIEILMGALTEALKDDDQKRLKELRSAKKIDRKIIAELSHIVVNALINDLVENSRKQLEKLMNELKNQSITDSKELYAGYDLLHKEQKLTMKRNEVISFSDRVKQEQLDGFIRESIHHSRNVERMNEKGKYIIRKLFEAYYTHPQQLPDGPILHMLVECSNDSKYSNIDKAKAKGIGKARVDFEKMMENPTLYKECVLMRRVCDHIASMTDRYAIDEYNNLYG